MTRKKGQIFFFKLFLFILWTSFTVILSQPLGQAYLLAPTPAHKNFSSTLGDEGRGWTGCFNSPLRHTDLPYANPTIFPLPGRRLHSPPPHFLSFMRSFFCLHICLWVTSCLSVFSLTTYFGELTTCSRHS